VEGVTAAAGAAAGAGKGKGAREGRASSFLSPAGVKTPPLRPGRVRQGWGHLPRGMGMVTLRDTEAAAAEAEAGARAAVWRRRLAPTPSSGEPLTPPQLLPLPRSSSTTSTTSSSSSIVHRDSTSSSSPAPATDTATPGSKPPPPPPRRRRRWSSLSGSARRPPRTATTSTPRWRRCGRACQILLATS